MGNEICPECGCELNAEEEEKWTGEYHNILIVEITTWCTCCEYQETSYED